jgi:hypothetical protein
MTQDIIINCALALLDRVEHQEDALRVALEALKISIFDVSEDTIRKRHEAVEKVQEALERNYGISTTIDYAIAAMKGAA